MSPETLYKVTSCYVEKFRRRAGALGKPPAFSHLSASGRGIGAVPYAPEQTLACFLIQTFCAFLSPSVKAGKRTNTTEKDFFKYQRLKQKPKYVFI